MKKTGKKGKLNLRPESIRLLSALTEVTGGLRPTSSIDTSQPPDCVPVTCRPFVTCQSPGEPT